MKPKASPKTDQSTVRQRIVDMAARLFHQQGYNQTGINQLIEEAGVAKASLYQHFKTKDDVLQAYLAQVSQDWFRQVERAIAPLDTPKEKVLALFDLLKSFLESVDFRGCNFQNALVELPPAELNTRQLIRGHKTKMSQVITDLLADADPDLAAQISLLFEGALITSQLYHSVEPVNAARRIVERLL
ncbi:TetR/AcrR family transcriptional regulator [Spirosoma sp. SC4-14]|uniref:TetR/AcrR family transcriptional regulator n=1 Tax=Spirosoma sp. SC4-14 TaxID=3128900 RepID=UPI0030D2E9B9